MRRRAMRRSSACAHSILEESAPRGHRLALRKLDPPKAANPIGTTIAQSGYAIEEISVLWRVWL
jgi:hypothetical protein